MTCTKKQVQTLLKYSKNLTQEAAAVKAGVSLRTARKYLKMGGQMVDRPEWKWRQTHKDAFAEVWSELEAILKTDPGVQAQTLMQWLIEEKEGFSWSQLRTLQRRVQRWHALQGPDKEVMFKQQLLPGKQSQSDWTNCDELKVTIGGRAYPHLLYHFMLPYSRWETAHISASESFENLTCGYMRAVAELGAVAENHRTDNLSAAVNNHGNQHTFNERWTAFLAHYGVKPSKNNPGESHENGSVEKSHDLLKSALNQSLILRRSRDFSSVAEYEKFIRRVLDQRNKLRRERLAEEMAVLEDLPDRDWNDPVELRTTVTAWSTVTVDKAVYSVPARLIGMRLRALSYPETIRLFLGPTLVLEMPRQEPGSRRINYRHIIGWLVRKPGAFAGYQYRDELFPSLNFRRTYDALKAWRAERADREYLAILHQAAMDNEQDVEAALELLLEQDQVPTVSAVKELARKKQPEVPTICIDVPDLCSYDRLLNYLQKAPKETPS
ncbi:MAG: IS21 family transposase [Candidatus Obscuribacterales bacterium]|nr:IS21 family transposase [Candidatus Obscuribacterales bacterium]